MGHSRQEMFPGFTLVISGSLFGGGVVVGLLTCKLTALLTAAAPLVTVILMVMAAFYIATWPVTKLNTIGSYLPPISLPIKLLGLGLSPAALCTGCVVYIIVGLFVMPATFVISVATPLLIPALVSVFLSPLLTLPVALVGF